MQKRALAIHDISCVGRCSLTVALPVLSAAGIETSVLPTALLSTHTGNFKGFTYHDLSEDIPPILSHWESLHLQFDALYSGFLGSFEQIGLIEELFTRFRTPDTLILVDPAMADQGRLYTTYTPQMAYETKRLCAMADIIVPNLTEAALLLDEPYRENLNQAQIERMLKDLCALGPKKAVLTGVGFEENLLGTAAYDRETGDVTYTFSKRYEQVFFGTGDVFASALLAALLRGRTLSAAAETAAAFVHDAIAHTLLQGRELRYGVAFELALPGLITALNS